MYRYRCHRTITIFIFEGWSVQFMGILDLFEVMFRHSFVMQLLQFYDIEIFEGDDLLISDDGPPLHHFGIATDLTAPDHINR